VDYISGSQFRCEYTQLLSMHEPTRNRDFNADWLPGHYGQRLYITRAMAIVPPMPERSAGRYRLFVKLLSARTRNRTKKRRARNAQNN